MIAKLSGTIDYLGESYLIIDVKGVGYKVFCSQKALAQLESGSSVTLFIETIVREDALTLYGFKEFAEQEWFTLLTTVQGVGARVALAILSVCERSDLISAIVSQDKAYISRADGVGPKLADRIVNELKNKVKGFSTVTGNLSSPSSLHPANSNIEDAISALTNLGYRRLEATQAIQKVAHEQDNSPVETLIRDGLKILSGG